MCINGERMGTAKDHGLPRGFMPAVSHRQVLNHPTVSRLVKNITLPQATPKWYF